MILGITQRRTNERGGTDALEIKYREYFKRFNIDLIAIPNIGRDVRKYLESIKIDGLILSGGGDIHPSIYKGDETFPGNYSSERDETENVLLVLAVQERIRVLGICRGLEGINAHFGGSLIQSLTTKVPDAVNHDRATHDIRITDPRLAESLGADTATVNSYHRQGMMTPQLAPTLRPFAFAEDQTIEGAYHQELPIAGVMWHPERWDSPTQLDKILTDAFISQQIFWK